MFRRIALGTVGGLLADRPAAAALPLGAGIGRGTFQSTVMHGLSRARVVLLVARCYRGCFNKELRIPTFNIFLTAHQPALTAR